MKGLEGKEQDLLVEISPLNLNNCNVISQLCYQLAIFNLLMYPFMLCQMDGTLTLFPDTHAAGLGMVRMYIGGKTI